MIFQLGAKLRIFNDIAKPLAYLFLKKARKGLRFCFLLRLSDCLVVG